MDVYKLLREDHRKVKGIFRELEDTTERAVRTREHLFAHLNIELSLHSEAEEKFFYSRLESDHDTRELTLESIEDHKVVKSLLAELGRIHKGTEEWAAKLIVLREIVERHIKEEEDVLFKKASRVLSDEDAESVSEEIQAYKEVHFQLELPV